MGAFVVFTIDPIASLDPDAIEDPEAVAACKQLVNKPYVALAQRKEFYRPWDPYNECIVDFVLQGKPRASPDICMEPSMSIPIVPATVAHPLSRIPLVPTNPLPWKDCYVSCFFAARVRSRTQFTEERIDWRLPMEERHKQSRFLMEDMARKHDIAWGRTAAQATSSSVISDARNEFPSADADWNAATVNANEGQVDGLPRSVSLVTAEDEDESELDSVDDLFEYAPQGMITVRFTHDLSIVKELNDPDDYFREVAAIDQIKADARRRRKEA
ncbi:hypothetical protein C8R47DRAFT_1017265, partial [Mycena vitilis]